MPMHACRYARRLMRDPVTGVLIWPGEVTSSGAGGSGGETGDSSGGAGSGGGSSSASAAGGGHHQGKQQQPYLPGRGRMRKLVWLEGELVWHYRDSEGDDEGP